MSIGLRIDVDTLRGTARGVPALLRTLDRHGVRASFFFSVGPDNMGRHLWRLARPTFLAKMLRSGAPSLYGWSILFRGTLGPGPRIGARCADVIRSAARAGHEIGLHAWDHHAWQAHIERMDADAVEAVVARGVDALAEITGAGPTCSAAPGWKCTDAVLRAKSRFGFAYNSDVRGEHPFRPLVDGAVVGPVQIPVSLPTYDEVVGRDVSRDEYNAYMLERLPPDGTGVLAIHAEVEGIGAAGMFDAFLEAGRARGATFGTLGAIAAATGEAPARAIEARAIAGREGTVACVAE